MKQHLLFIILCFLIFPLAMAKDLSKNNLNNIDNNLSDDYNSNYIEIIKIKQMLPSLIDIDNIKNKMAYGAFSNVQINNLKKQITSVSCNDQDDNCRESKLTNMQFLTFIQNEDVENKGQLNTYQTCLHINFKERKNFCYSYTNLYGATLLASLLKDERNDIDNELNHESNNIEREKIFNIYQTHVNFFMHNIGFIKQEDLMINKLFEKGLSNQYTHLNFSNINYQEQREKISNLLNYNLILILYSSTNENNLTEISQNEKHSENKKNITSCNYLFLFQPKNNNYSTCLIH